MSAENVVKLSVTESALDAPFAYAAQLLAEIDSQLSQVNAVAFAASKAIGEEGDLTSRALFDTIEKLTEERAALHELRRLISRQTT